MVTSHQVTLSGLAAGTTYYYQVNSTDSKGNHYGHGGNKFKTQASVMSRHDHSDGGWQWSGSCAERSGERLCHSGQRGQLHICRTAEWVYQVTPTHTGYASRRSQARR